MTSTDQPVDFFEPGRTYLHHGEDGQPSTEGLFRVEYVDRAPEPFEAYDETLGVAFGWRQGIDANGDWTGLGSYSTPDFAGWQEVRPALDAESPDGCRWCGEARHHHGQQYLPGRGLHGWEQPTDRQRLERMRARRAARLAPRAPLDPSTIVTLTATAHALAAALKAAIPDELVEARLAALHAQAEAGRP